MLTENGKSRITVFLLFGVILWVDFSLFKSPLLAAAVGALIIASLWVMPTEERLRELKKAREERKQAEQEQKGSIEPKPVLLFSGVSEESRDGL